MRVHTGVTAQSIPVRNHLSALIVTSHSQKIANEKDIRIHTEVAALSNPYQ